MFWLHRSKVTFLRFRSKRKDTDSVPVCFALEFLLCFRSKGRKLPCAENQWSWSILSPAPWASCDLVTCFIFSVKVSVATFLLHQEAPGLQGCGSGSPAQGCLQLAQEMGVVGGHRSGPLVGGLFPQVEAWGLQVSGVGRAGSPSWVVRRPEVLTLCHP